jgi:hypothetical protein
LVLKAQLPNSKFNFLMCGFVDEEFGFKEWASIDFRSLFCR